MKQVINFILKIIIIVLLCVILVLEYKIYTSKDIMPVVKYDGKYEIPEEVYEMIEKEKSVNEAGK